MRILVILLLSLIPVQAFAEGGGYSHCYSAREAEAEQGIRIKSELMVIGLNCQHMTPRGWKNFYQEYREIAARNQGLFSDYERTLISHYAAEGSGEKKLHTLRTGFANRISTNSAQMRPDVFCATYAPRIPKVGKMSQAEIQAWALNAGVTQPQSKPVCR